MDSYTNRLRASALSYDGGGVQTAARKSGSDKLLSMDQVGPICAVGGAHAPVLTPEVRDALAMGPQFNASARDGERLDPALIFGMRPTAVGAAI